MPIVKRARPVPSKYVYTDKGILVVKTPPETTKWPHDFRLRIVRDYIAPNKLVRAEELAHAYDPKEIYSVQGHRVLFRQSTEEVPRIRGVVLVKATEVIDLDSKRVMFLSHGDPAMRVLMVYCFLTQMTMWGVASYSTYDWKPAE